METIKAFFRGTPRTTPSNTPRETSPATPRSLSATKFEQQPEASTPRGKRTTRVSIEGGERTPDFAGGGAVGSSMQLAEDSQSWPRAPQQFSQASLDSWEVLWQDGVNVRRNPDRSAESLRIKAKGAVVSGSHQDGWLELADEPGFMFIGDESCPLLQRIVLSETSRWEVVWPDGVHVRTSADRSSASRAIKEKGCLVSGHQLGSWVALTDEPGFMFTGTPENNCILLRKVGEEPDLDAMMAAAEAKRQEVEAKATRLMKLFSGGDVIADDDPAGHGCTTVSTASALPAFANPGSVRELSTTTTAANQIEGGAVSSSSRPLVSSGTIQSARGYDAIATATPFSSPPQTDTAPVAVSNIAFLLEDSGLGPTSPRAFGTALTAKLEALSKGETLPVQTVLSPNFGDGSTAEREAAPSASSTVPATLPNLHRISQGPREPCGAALPATTIAPWQPCQAVASDAQDRPLQRVSPDPVLMLPPPVPSTDKPFTTLDRPASSIRSRSGPPTRKLLTHTDNATDRIEGQETALISSDALDACALQRSFQQRVQETRGRVDRTMLDIYDVRSRLGAQEERLTSLTRSLSAARASSPGCSDQRSRQASRAQSMRPEVRNLFSSMVEELHDISALASKGEQVSKEVEAVRSDLQSLTMESSTSRSLPAAELSTVAVLPTACQVTQPDEASRLVQNLRSELVESVGTLRTQVTRLAESDDRRTKMATDCIQDLSTLRDEFNSFKDRLVAQPSELASGAIAMESSPNNDVAVLRGTLADTAAMLKSELLDLAGQAIQCSTENAVSKQDLDDALMQIRRDMSVALGGLREESIHLAASLPTPNGQGVRALDDETINTLSELRSRLDKTARDALDARRDLDALQEEMSAQLTRAVSQQELTKTTEFLSKEFKLMLDVTMNNFHQATRQELAQTSSQLRRELRPLADFGASADSAATRRELTEAIEQLRQELHPAANGESSPNEVNGRHWTQLVGVVENLLEDVAQLGEKASHNEQAAAAEIAEARRRVEGLSEDVGILKDQGRLRGEEARLEKESVEQLLVGMRGEQRQAMEGLRHEVVTSQALRSDLASLVEQVSKSEAGCLSQYAGMDVMPGNNGQASSMALTRSGQGPPVRGVVSPNSEDASRCDGAVTRRELADVVDGIKHELAMMIDGKQTNSQFVSRQELVDLVDSIMEEVTKRIKSESDARSGSPKVVAEVAETQRILATLAEDVGLLKTRMLGNEAVTEKEWLEQRFRILRQELTLALEEIRSQQSQCNGASAVSGKMSPSLVGVQSPQGESCRDLREDLTVLQTRQEFLRNELKCLVDTTMLSRNPSILPLHPPHQPDRTGASAVLREPRARSDHH